MIYFKNVEDGVVQSVNSVDGSGRGNINEAEYTTLCELFRNLPDGKVIQDGDGEYVYIDDPNPPDPDPEIDDSELLEILMGVTE